MGGTKKRNSEENCTKKMRRNRTRSKSETFEFLTEKMEFDTEKERWNMKKNESK